MRSWKGQERKWRSVTLRKRNPDERLGCISQTPMSRLEFCSRGWRPEPGVSGWRRDCRGLAPQSRVQSPGPGLSQSPGDSSARSGLQYWHKAGTEGAK